MKFEGEKNVEIRGCLNKTGYPAYPMVLHGEIFRLRQRMFVGNCGVNSIDMSVLENVYECTSAPVHGPIAQSGNCRSASGVQLLQL